MEILEHDKGIVITDVSHFGLRETLDNGSTFRWQYMNDNRYLGVVNNKVIQVMTLSNNRLFMDNITAKEYETYFRNYFDFNSDYDTIYKALLNNETLNKLVPKTTPLRLLKQDFVESFISAYISQNNNINRIKGIIYRLCEYCGNHLAYRDRMFYTFPTLKQLNNLTVNEFKFLGLGYRAEGIVKAITRLLILENEKGNLNEYIKSLDYSDLYYYLMDFKGIGDKVANFIIAMTGSCRDYMAAFVVDVWIKRAIHDLFNVNTDNISELEGLKEKVFKNYNAIAQQNIFYYYRNK